MRKKAILIVGLALLVAAAGVVYAHWTETLKVDATVNTGTAFVRSTNIFTDDDGGTTIGEETGLPTPAFCTGDPTCAGPGSVDPASFSDINVVGGLPVLATAASRYDKDVADCWSGITDGGTTGKLMWVQIANVYPSYHCTISSTLQNQGTVPMMQNANPKKFLRNGLPVLPVAAAGGGYYIDDPAHPGVHELWFATVHGTLCGGQIDPGESWTTTNEFHLLNAAPEGATYEMMQEIVFVNWNESTYFGQGESVCPFELLP